MQMQYKYVFASVNERAVPVMRLYKVRNDFKKLSSFNITLLMMQEIWPTKYRRVLRSIFTHHWFHLPRKKSGKGESTVIVGDRNVLTILTRWVRPAHDAIRGVCDTRVVTCARAHDADLGVKITAMSFHPTPGAWNRGWRPLKKTRQKRWIEAVNRLRRYAESQVNAGYPVVIGMDGNADADTFLAHFGNRIGGREIKIVNGSHPGIDHMVFCSSVVYNEDDEPTNEIWQWYIDREVTRNVKTNSDHKALIVWCGLRKEAA